VSPLGGPVLLDMSAWARLLLGRVPAPESSRYEEAVRADEVLICEPFRLEALYSARGADEYLQLGEELAALPNVISGPATFRLALDGQAALAREPAVAHRVKPIDLMVAAIAHEHGLGVLHYDHDYDTIAAHSGLRVRSVWLAARGSLD
jgi:predicted nucleic acid-binding protein